MLPFWHVYAPGVPRPVTGVGVELAVLSEPQAAAKMLNIAIATSKNATRNFLTIQTPNPPHNKYYIVNTEPHEAYQYKRKLVRFALIL